MLRASAPPPTRPIRPPCGGALTCDAPPPPPSLRWDAFDAGRSLGTGGDDDDDDDFGFGSLTLNMGEADSAALDDDFDPFS